MFYKLSSTPPLTFTSSHKGSNVQPSTFGKELQTIKVKTKQLSIAFPQRFPCTCYMAQIGSEIPVMSSVFPSVSVSWWFRDLDQLTTAKTLIRHCACFCEI